MSDDLRNVNASCLPVSGDLALRDPSDGHHPLWYAIDQVILYLKYDRDIHAGTALKGNCPKPGGYRDFAEAWNVDPTSSYGFSYLDPIFSTPVIIRNPAPFSLLIPADHNKISVECAKTADELAWLLAKCAIEEERRNERGKKAHLEGKGLARLSKGTTSTHPTAPNTPQLDNPMLDNLGLPPNDNFIDDPLPGMDIFEDAPIDPVEHTEADVGAGAAKDTDGGKK